MLWITVIQFVIFLIFVNDVSRRRYNHNIYFGLYGLYPWNNFISPLKLLDEWLNDFLFGWNTVNHDMLNEKLGDMIKL